MDLVKAVDINLFGTIVQYNLDISYGIELPWQSTTNWDEISTAQDLSDELLMNQGTPYAHSNMSVLHSQPSQNYDSNMINLTYPLPSKQKSPNFAINSICNTLTLSKNMMPKWRWKSRRRIYFHRFSYSRQISIIWLVDQDMSWLCGLFGLLRQTCF